MQNLTPVIPLETPSSPRRRTGKIAKLSKSLRDIINQMLEDGAKYSDIIQTLAAQGVSLNQENISNWHHGGYQDWVQQQIVRDQLKISHETLLESFDKDPANLTQSVLQFAVIEVFRHIMQMSQAPAGQPVPDPNFLVRILNILPRLSHQLLSLQKYQDTRPKTGALGTAEFQLKEKEREAVLDVIDDILGCKAYRRGSGFKPAPPSPPKDEPLPPTEPPKPSEEPFNSIQSNSNLNPSLSDGQPAEPQNPNSSAPEVPINSIQSDSNLSPSSPDGPAELKEHCQVCGDPLPALTANGERPEHWCSKCGTPLPRPGTSIRQRCPECYAYLPLIGYRVERIINRCLKCGSDLPNVRPPWAPPKPAP